LTGPLSHLKVLDLSRVLAGPWTGQNLADLGAEVIKVERPGVGDDTRHWGPPFLTDKTGAPTGEAAYFLCANRGKKSIAIDLACKQGQALVRRLAAGSDILIENFKVGGLARYGLDYDSLSAAVPGLIYCSITGFGQTGPYRDRAGYDFMIQGLGGLMSVTGERDDKPGGGPQKVGVAIADIMTGQYATIAILAALAERERTGKGQHIDMALLDCQVAMLANQNMNYLVSGQPPGRMGNAHPNIAPYQAFATADGHVILAVGNDRQFARFCAVAGRPELARDVRFARPRTRVENRAALIDIITPIMAARASADWLAALEEAGVPCGPINTLEQVFEDEQVIHRGLRREVPHALAGAVPQVANPIRLGGVPLDHDVGPPALGEHTNAVLHDQLGLDEGEIAALRQAGVVA